MAAPSPAQCCRRSAKQCLEILDELFGRDRRAPDQILDQLDVLGRKGAGRAELGAGDEMRHQPVRHAARFHALLGLLGCGADISNWPAEHLREHLGEGAVGREFAGELVGFGSTLELAAKTKVVATWLQTLCDGRAMADNYWNAQTCQN